MNTILNSAPLAIFLIMLGVGMSVTIKNFIEVFKDPKILLIGLMSQMVILPLVGILFAIFAPVDLIFKLGLVLITCVPSAVTSNYITKLVDGNIALSVSLTAITACLSFITIPFILVIITPIVLDGANDFQDLDFIKMSLGLLLITTIPILIGMAINIKFSIFVEKINKFYSIFSLLLFISIIFTAWISEWNVIIGLYKSIGFLVTALAAVVLFTSYTLVNLLNINEANKKTIVIETFIQNAAMAIIVGGVTFGPGSGYLAIAALYALFQYKIILFLWATNNFINLTLNRH
jgi:BASS family bile acid:Na+ symporter